MTLLCPDCRRDLILQDGTTAVCPAHGDVYRILYQRSVAVAAPPLPAKPFSAEPLPGEVCRQHPGVAATHRCADCGQVMCDVCSFAGPDGRTLCPTCIARPQPAAMPVPPTVAPGVMCAVHPTVPAVHRCRSCGAPVCATCDFAYPGDVHLCPACVSNPRPAPSRRRQRNVIISLVLAGVGTLAFMGLFTVGFIVGFVHGSHSNEDLNAALDVGFLLFVLAPAVAGIALALSSLDRRFVNPAAVWIAVVWNALLLAGMVLLIIIGILVSGG